MLWEAIGKMVQERKVKCEVECTTWVNCFQTIFKKYKPEYLVVEPGIILPKCLVELDKGFTIL